MKKPFIPEYRKAKMTGDYREIALSLCADVEDTRHYPKYVPFGRSFANERYYTFDGRKLRDETYVAAYLRVYCHENNLNIDEYILFPNSPLVEYIAPCRYMTVKDLLETTIDDYLDDLSYEKAFKDMFNITYHEDIEIMSRTLERYIPVMQCPDPDNPNVTFNVAIADDLTALVKDYADKCKYETIADTYFSEWYC